LLAVLATLSGCSPGADQGAGAAGMFGGPVPVRTVTVQPETIPVSYEYTGQTIGSREAQIRARVTGILEKRNYREGATVKAGQSLFTIDPASYRTALARAEADLAAARARHAQARREAERLRPLHSTRAISQKEYDDAASAEAIAAADVQAARARADEARLNLDWTRVTSPITGVASRALASEGSLVSGPDVLLTTVTQLDPMHVLFGIPDSARLALRREVAEGIVSLPDGARFRATLTLSDGTQAPLEGLVDFSSVRISNETGTAEARAEFPNPDGLLHPGQFVRVRLTGAVRGNAFRVPQRAVLEGPQGKFVYVVDADGKAAVRPVRVGDWAGDDWVIHEGLAGGERVIVDGLLKLGPGAPVKADEASADAPPAAAGPADANR
jgi:membrane fusion protein (multidrug efflux system)